MSDHTLEGEIIQVIEPDEHDEYSLSEPMKVIAEGYRILVVADAEFTEASTASKWFRSLSPFDEHKPPTVLCDSDEPGVGDTVRMRAERTHLDGIYQSKRVAVVDSKPSPTTHPGECHWCEADFSRYGRFLGALLSTVHVFRHHPAELEAVGDGADPEEVPVQDDAGETTN